MNQDDYQQALDGIGRIGEALGYPDVARSLSPAQVVEAIVARAERLTAVVEAARAYHAHRLGPAIWQNAAAYTAWRAEDHRLYQALTAALTSIGGDHA